MDDNLKVKSKFLAYGSTADNLFLVPLDVRKNMAKVWSEPRIRPKDNKITYRFLNYLDNTGLLPDSRDGSESGWRKFSIRDCIYLELVLALRDFGVKAEQIYPVYELFCQPYTSDKDAADGRSDWLDIMLAVSFGDEVELFVENGVAPYFCDPIAAGIYGTSATMGILRISMSRIVNKFRKDNGLKEIVIKKTFASSGLSEAETDTILNMRNLDDSCRLTLKRTSSGILSKMEKEIDIDGEITNKINELVPDEYADISVIKRDKEVVRLKTSIPKLYKD